MGTNSRYERNVFSQSRREYFEHDEREFVGGRGSVEGSSRYPNQRPGYRNRQGGSWHSGEGQRHFNHTEGSWRGGRGRGHRGRVPQRNNRNEDFDASSSSAGGRSRHQAMYDHRVGSRKNNRYKFDSRNDRNKKNNLGWHKIIIQDGGNYNKEEVLKAIREFVTDDFSPVMFEPEGSHLVFYLENNGEAVEAIEKVSKRIRMPGNNHKLYVRTNQSAPPSRTLTPEQTDIVRVVMSTRYSVEMSRLNLKNLHNDPRLMKENIFCPLNRRPNMQMVVGLICEHVKWLKEIDLGFNKIFFLDHLEDLVANCSNLARLSLEKNKIPSIVALDKLKGLQIIELTLKDNPLCDKFKDQESYISAVRQRFPKVMYLDGQELPKPVTFDLEEDSIKLPDMKSSFYCNAEAKSIILEFIKQYYQVFDTDNRKPLEAAYTEDATFSLSVAFPETGPGSRYVQPYLQENRNLMKHSDSDRRQDKLVRGRGKIIEVLAKLPHSTHDPSSFVIDIPIAQPQLVKVVLTGVYRQIADRSPPIRSFIRVLVIVPLKSGFCISNELLSINNATIEQIKMCFKQKSEVPSTSAGPGPPPMPELNEDQKKGISDFHDATGMLPVYCGMCLEQNEWDYSKAGAMFLSLKNEGKIPPEYYPPTMINRLL